MSMVMSSPVVASVMPAVVVAVMVSMVMPLVVMASSVMSSVMPTSVMSSVMQTSVMMFTMVVSSVAAVMSSFTVVPPFMPSSLRHIGTSNGSSTLFGGRFVDCAFPQELALSNQGFESSVDQFLLFAI